MITFTDSEIDEVTWAAKDYEGSIVALTLTQQMLEVLGTQHALMVVTPTGRSLMHHILTQYLATCRRQIELKNNDDASR